MIYLSLGSNLGNRFEFLQVALGIIAYRLGSVPRCSPVYETPAWGFDSAPFLNACVEIETSHSAEEILTIALETERYLGRERSSEQEGYQARTIDIDLLFYDQEIIQNDFLTLPHPRLELRRFILAPFVDLAPQHYHPVLHQNCEELLKNCPDTSVIHRMNDELYPTVPKKYIAVEGIIGAGKTAFAHSLSKALSATLLLENFVKNPYLADFYESPEKFALKVEDYFLEERKHQQSAFFAAGKEQMTIADYTLQKSLLFAQMNLEKKEAEVYTEKHKKISALFPEPEGVVFLEVSVQRAHKNVRHRGRKMEESMPIEYLEKLKGTYDQWRQNSTLPILTLPSDSLDFVQNKEDLLRLLFLFFTHRF